ncbi:MAG: hypothetical protein AAGD96_34900, partial [Chloroflexota bacterium]
MTFPLGWLPVQLSYKEKSVTFLQVAQPADLKTNVPRFGTVIDNYKALHPDAQERQGTFDDLNGLKELGRSPDGLIFHSSRVGSTASAVALADTSNCFVIDEGGILNNAIRVEPNPAEILELAVRGLSQFLQPEDHFVIKTSSWNITRIGTYLTAFPDIPWIFLYRDLIEMMVS